MSCTGPTTGTAVAAVTAIVCSAGRTAAHLSPVAVAPDWHRGRIVDLLHACRTTVRDVQPFVFVVLLLRSADPPPDQLMALVHQVVGTAVLSVDTGATATMDGQVALIVADSTRAVAGLLGSGEATVWDPTSHYYWLVPAAGPTDARTLFRVAWRRRSLANAVLVAESVAYTYNPFNDTLAAGPVDAVALRDRRRRKMDDLHGHPVRICMFPTRLGAVKQPDGTYRGTDGLVASTLAEHLNFTPVYSEPTDGRKYGWAENTSDSELVYFGLLGDLVYNKADIAFNSVFLKKYHHNNTIRYTTPVMFDELCFVVPMAQQMSQWRAVFHAFDVRLWYCLAATFAVALGTWSLIKRTTGQPPHDTDTLALHLFQMFLMVPLTRVPQNVPERLMVVSTVLFGFITATSLQAVMVKYLNHPRYERNLATVQQVYDSGMPILVASTNLIMMFESDDDALYVKLSDRFVMNKYIDILTEVAQKKSSVAMGRKNELAEKIAGSYVADNKALLHIVDACPRSFHFVYLVRRDVPFVDAINRVITTFVESGIVSSRYMRTNPFRPLSDHHQPNNAHSRFAVRNVVIAFLFLAVGLAVSGVAFVAELVYYHRLAAAAAAPPGTTRYPRRPLPVRWF